MKASHFCLVIAAFTMLLPQIILKAYLYNKFTNKDWIFHSARQIVPMNDVNEIVIKNIQEFRYEYSNDSSFLEFNEEEAESRYDIKTIGNKISISSASFKLAIPPGDQNIFNQKFNFSTSLIYSTMNINNQLLFLAPPRAPKVLSESLIASRKLVFKGKNLPKVVAQNSILFIDSIGQNQSFEMDLDFSKCNWENFKKHTASGKATKTTDIDRSLTNTWRIDTLNMKLQTGTFFFNKDLKFNQISIDATHKADLHFESDDYSNADIFIDSTVMLRAPYSIWKNLKVIEKK